MARNIFRDEGLQKNAESSLPHISKKWGSCRCNFGIWTWNDVCFPDSVNILAPVVAGVPGPCGWFEWSRDSSTMLLSNFKKIVSQHFTSNDGRFCNISFRSSLGEIELNHICFYVSQFPTFILQWFVSKMY